MTDSASFLDRNHFLLRRLHSLTGVAPIGLFLIVHLLTNSTAFLDPAKFNHEVSWIHDLPYLIFIEWFGIILPLLFHAGYGVFIAMTGRSNARQYGWVDNWRYTLQRVTGWIAFVFVIVHLFHFRLRHWLGGANYQVVSTAESPFAATVAGFESLTFLWVLLYSIGLIASVFHFANGICTFCITWGITVNERSRRGMNVAAGGLGVVMLIWGFLSLYGLTAGADRETPSQEPAKSLADKHPAQARLGG